MNSYMLFTQEYFHMNDIPPRLMWNIVDSHWLSSSSGYCGETSLQTAALQYGQYIPQYIVRQLLVEYFSMLWGDEKKPSIHLKKSWDLYTGLPWNHTGSPGGDHKNIDKGTFEKHGQYYCQVLPQIWDARTGADNSGFRPLEELLKTLHLSHDQFKPDNFQYKTEQTFIPWVKQKIYNGYPVIIGVQDFLVGSNDPDYDHIVVVLGWGSNQELSSEQYFRNDEIVFSDHGLAICGRQPIGGSIPFYFRYVMETEMDTGNTGGWLPDGGCPDPSNPAWNFILNLGQSREINGHVCNTYQLAQHPGKTNGNAGFAITGLSDSLPPDVDVRIHTDSYYEIPCITTEQAKSGNKPVTHQTMKHTITVSGLDPYKTYNLWLFIAGDTEQFRAIPKSGFNQYGLETKAEHHRISKTKAFTCTYSLKSDIALLVRCVLESDN